MEEKLNLLHLYTGEGKGKTTAAMGWHCAHWGMAGMC